MRCVFGALLLPLLLFSCEKINLTSDGVESVEKDTDRDTFYVWNGHVVVGEHRLADGGVEVMLISLYEWSDMPSAKHVTDSGLVSLLAEGYQEMDLDGWHIPTTEEAKRLRETLVADLDALGLLNQRLLEVEAVPVSVEGRYLCEEGRKSFSLAPGTTISNAGSKAKSYRLRLLRQVVLP